MAAQWLYEHLRWWALPGLRNLAHALDRRNERRVTAACPPRMLVIGGSDAFIKSVPVSPLPAHHPPDGA